jgi:hypothetical protein
LYQIERPTYMGDEAANGTCAVTCYADYSYSGADAWFPGSEGYGDTGESTGPCALGCSPRPVAHPRPKPPPRDCIQAHNCPKDPIPASLETAVITHHNSDATDPATLGCPGHCIQEQPTARTGPVTGTTAVGSATAGDTSTTDLDQLIQAITNIGQPDVLADSGTSQAALGSGGGSDGGGGTPPSVVPASCDPNGEGFGELASGQVPPADDLAALGAMDLPDGMPPTDPAADDIADLLWEARRLTGDQVREAYLTAESMLSP